MNINEEKLSFIDIEEDLDEIGKKLYLESPDLWIDFCDKVGDKVIDEMILFYAAKFNYVSIIKFATYNEILNLDNPSKNRSYSSIKEHLLSVSKDCKSKDVYNFLSGNCEIIEDKIDHDKDNCITETQNNYFPVYSCPHCDTNIFKTGYKIYEEINFAFCEKTNESKELNRFRNDKVFCSNCNRVVDNVTIDLLENLSSIHNCRKCGKDLIKTGINEKIKMSFNNESNKFDKNEKTYNCSNCDEALSNSQVKYFNL